MQSSVRRHDIDAVRVIGTLLVFLFHCVQPFNPNDSWHIQNAERRVALGYVIMFFNIWIMPLFTLLAGASSFFALKKRTNVQYLRERFTRIFVPLVLGMLIFVAPQVYLERRFKGQFSGSYLEFYPHFFEGVYPQGNFSWHHLWFLAYLFVYSVIGLVIFRVLLSSSGKRKVAGFASLCERKPPALLALAVPLIIFHVCLFWEFPQTNSLVNDWAWHAQLFTAFIYGFVLVADERFAGAIGKIWRKCLMAAIVMTVGTLALRLLAIISDTWLTFACRGLLYRSATWLWLLAILGAGRVYLSQPSTRLSYLSGASYPFYILHQGFIIGAAFLMLPWDMPMFAKFAAIVATAFVGTALSYEFSRRMPPLRLVLGIGQPKA